MVTFHYSNIPLNFIGDPAAKFDPLKYHWLGSPSIGGLPRTVFIRSELNIRTLEDLKNSKRTLAMGATGANTASAVAGKFLKQLGYPVKNVIGYRGSSGAMAALERKEVDGRITTQSSVETVYKRFLDEDIIRPVLSLGTEPLVKHFPGIATDKDLKLDGNQKKLMKFFIRSWRFLRRVLSKASRSTLTRSMGVPGGAAYTRRNRHIRIKNSINSTCSPSSLRSFRVAIPGKCLTRGSSPIDRIGRTIFSSRKRL